MALKRVIIIGTDRGFIYLQFISRFTENRMDGEKLEKVYLKIKAGKASNAAVHSIGAGTSGETPFISPSPSCPSSVPGSRKPIHFIRMVM